MVLYGLKSVSVYVGGEGRETHNLFLLVVLKEDTNKK